jgi:hypothetical protein
MSNMFVIGAIFDNIQSRVLCVSGLKNHQDCPLRCTEHTAFLRLVSGRTDIAKGGMSSLHPIKRCTYLQPGAVTFSGTPGTEQNGNVTTSPTIQGALEIEAGLMGAVV